jgi:hypothetical protein
MVGSSGPTPGLRGGGGIFLPPGITPADKSATLFGSGWLAVDGAPGCPGVSDPGVFMPGWVLPGVSGVCGAFGVSGA